jgi:hypothetical protein
MHVAAPPGEKTDARAAVDCVLAGEEEKAKPAGTGPNHRSTQRVPGAGVVRDDSKFGRRWRTACRSHP